MEFTKMQGAANDFVVVDGRKLKRDWSRLAMAVCDRHRGIGADSLIILLPTKKADFGMRTFDADGSEAETCGNGIRCLARYVLEKGFISPDTDEITIETVAEINRVRFEKKGGRVVKFWANMGKPRLAAEKIPVTLKPGNNGVVDINSMLSYDVRVNGLDLTLNFVSMGNPHAVHFSLEPVEDFPLSKIGPLVENLPIFPNRVNFEVARVLDHRHVEARVWERGVGETLACGSGACAITVASKLHGYTESKVDIKLPGGVLNAEWNGNGEVVLGGPAEIVFEGIWPD
ncbi:MAG: diaminopimelate epimerase [Chloroflexi bacterium RBG_16_58_8]|nr:MAG: diaminopimelate epimerase [Chloroflexi bacterium RBG_16_58_8]